MDTMPSVVDEQSETNALVHVEQARLQALYRLKILDTPPEQAFDDLTSLARYVAQTPFALISLVDHDRQWFKSVQGLQLQETPRICSFCKYTLHEPNYPLMVQDTHQDPRFVDNPLVTQAPHIRFYLGIPLVTADHHVLGTLCVLDQRPRELDSEVIDHLCMLARQVMSQIELREYHDLMSNRRLSEQERYVAKLEAYQRRLEEENHQLTTTSLTDRLTGVGNRAALDDWLDDAIERARHAHQPLSILMIDVDFFKQFNDRYGHLAGDELLRELAGLLQKIGRFSDRVARYGGEEFVMILAQTDRHDAWLVAERIRRTIERHLFHQGAITVSIGIATLPEQGQTGSHELLLLADQALYAVKQHDRNHCLHRDELPELL